VLETQIIMYGPLHPLRASWRVVVLETQIFVSAFEMECHNTMETNKKKKKNKIKINKYTIMN
jgi:hypothetical protein